MNTRHLSALLLALAFALPSHARDAADAGATAIGGMADKRGKKLTAAPLPAVRVQEAM